MVDFGTLDVASALKGQVPGSGQQRSIESKTSHARVIYWHYAKQYFGESSNVRSLASDDDILGVVSGVIEQEIAGISIEKSMNQPAGTFEISLMPSVNWKQKISPGDWLVIQMFDKAGPTEIDNTNVVMFGNVDRVSRSKQKDQKTGKTIVRYSISGRDFGKVFEDTDIFFNPYVSITSSKSLLDTLLHQKGLYIEGSPDALVSQAIDLFLSSDGVDVKSKNAEGSGHIDSLNQWLLPDEVLQFFGSSTLGGGSFGDILIKNIWSDLPGHAVRVALNPNSNGALWGVLERSSNMVVNEMYVDLQRNANGVAQPALTLRPRPTSVFFEDTSGALEDNFFSLLDLISQGEVLTLYHHDIKYDNLGRDGHARFNHIWLHPKMQDAEAATNQLANIGADGEVAGIGNPMQLNESVRRYGLKRSEEMVDFIYVSEGKSTTAAVDITKSFLEQRYDQLAFHHLYESGTVETYGTIEARLGIVLRIRPERYDAKSSDNPPTKIFYVEGYKHDWTFPGQWTTEWTLCCGQWESADKPFIDLDDDNAGQFDSDFDVTSLVKTTIDRGPDVDDSGTSVAGVDADPSSLISKIGSIG